MRDHPAVRLLNNLGVVIQNAGWVLLWLLDKLITGLAGLIGLIMCASLIALGAGAAAWLFFGEAAFAPVFGLAWTGVLLFMGIAALSEALSKAVLMVGGGLLLFAGMTGGLAWLLRWNWLGVVIGGGLLLLVAAVYVSIRSGEEPETPPAPPPDMFGTRVPNADAWRLEQEGLFDDGNPSPRGSL